MKGNILRIMSRAQRNTRSEAPAGVDAFQQILFLAQLLRYLFDRRLAADGLSTAQAMALTVADRLGRDGPPSLTQLADELASSHQNLAVLLRGLSRQGFATVEPDTSDGRVRRVVVQPAWREYWQQRDADDFGLIHDLFAVLSEQEQVDLTRLLARLREGVLTTYWETRGRRSPVPVEVSDGSAGRLRRRPPA